MAQLQSPIGPWYDRWKRAGWAVGALAIAVSTSITAITYFRLGPDWAGWFLVLAAAVAAGSAVFNLVRWMQLRRAFDQDETATLGYLMSSFRYDPQTRREHSIRPALRYAAF